MRVDAHTGIIRPALQRKFLWLEWRLTGAYELFLCKISTYIMGNQEVGHPGPSWKNVGVPHLNLNDLVRFGAI